MTVQPLFRFAPSPNGHLHLGHAFSALLNAKMAAEIGGQMLLRIENIDLVRCTPDLEQAARDDLHWLGLRWPEPVRRQSEHFADYEAALARLRGMDLLYPAFLSRSEIASHIAQNTANGATWARDPDGAPHYPTEERHLSEAERSRAIAMGKSFAWRLNMDKALQLIDRPLDWQETGPFSPSGREIADPAQWGDVVLARKDTPTSYHLSVVLDDALQGISHVVRGRDLFQATAIHRLLQVLLDLPAPIYHHHALILNEDGNKLSKSRHDIALAQLRDEGASAADIRRRIGF